MATPHVAGLASLARSFRPDLSYTDIKNAILDNGDSIASLAGKTVSGKRINAYNTLRAIDISPVITGVVADTGAYCTSGISYTVFATDNGVIAQSGYSFDSGATWQASNMYLTGST